MQTVLGALREEGDDGGGEGAVGLATEGKVQQTMRQLCCSCGSDQDRQPPGTTLCWFSLSLSPLAHCLPLCLSLTVLPSLPPSRSFLLFDFVRFVFVFVTDHIFIFVTGCVFLCLTVKTFF